MQGIPIEVAAGLGKGAVRDTAHMSETSPSDIVSAQAAKEAIEHDLLGRAALAIKAPMRWGKGSLRLRVKALGI